jgi:hypothetical protein
LRSLTFLGAAITEFVFSAEITDLEWPFSVKSKGSKELEISRTLFVNRFVWKKKLKNNNGGNGEKEDGEREGRGEKEDENGGW